MSRLWETWKHWTAIPWVRWAVLPALLAVLVFLVELLGFHAKQLGLPADQNIYRIRVDQAYTNKLALTMEKDGTDSGYTTYTIKYHRANGPESEGFSALDGRCILEIGEDYTEIGEQVDTILVFTDASVRVTGAADALDVCCGADGVFAGGRPPHHRAQAGDWLSHRGAGNRPGMGGGDANQHQLNMG